MKRLMAGVLLLSLIVCCTACGNGNHESSNNTEGTGISTSLEFSSGEKGEQNTENTTDSFVPSKEYDNVYPQHEPYGTGVGAMPGRVVWTHDPDSVEWDGNGYWWEPLHFDESVILNMVNDAIDSVGADFLMNEPTVTENNGALRGDPTVENYLHEAGLVGNAPSGTSYTDSWGNKVTNLGVHEHWNNSVDKLYSRNLGKDEGIELVSIMK